MKPRLLLIGWDAADWALINQMIEQGGLQTLNQLMNNGVSGHINTLEPPISPMLWTSIITGKTADEHGILGFTEPNPETGGTRPIYGSSRKCKSLLNILSQKGKVVNSIGWWPSHPPEPINGISVSERFAKLIGAQLQYSYGNVHPILHEQALQALRIHPEDMTNAIIGPFFPDADESLQPSQDLLNELIKIICETTNVHTAATFAMARNDWDLTCIYYDAIDVAAHHFMKYHPPKLAQVSDEDFKRYHFVMRGIYQYLDMMLERLLQLAGPNCHVMLVSDHGFYADHRRFMELPNVIAAPMYEHRPQGVFIGHGPHFNSGTKVYNHNLLDIAPSVLQFFNLPLAADMPGKPIQGLFKNSIEKWPSINSYEDQDQSFSYTAEYKAGGLDDFNALEHLIALGYIDPPSDDAKQQAELSLMYANYNLAKVYVWKGEYNKAEPLLFDLKNKQPDYLPFIGEWLEALLLQGKYEQAREAVELLKSNTKLPDDFKKRLEVSYLLHTGNYLNAGKLFDQLNVATDSAVSDASLQWRLGFRQNAKAILEAYFNKVDDNAQAFNLMSAMLVDEASYDSAIDFALKALAIDFNFSQAHYHLGIACLRLGQYVEAEKALLLSLKLNPKLIKAANMLIELYELSNADIEKVNYIKNNYLANLNEIIIVSGLPRSGTSLMMRILSANGVPLLTDHSRAADEHNPDGYYEYAPVKAIAHQNDWLNLAVGKAVKVVGPLLQYLSPKFKYKVIYVYRDPIQIHSSQKKMRFGAESQRNSNLNLNALNWIEDEQNRNLALLKNAPNIECQLVSYQDLKTNAEGVSLSLSAFLNQSITTSSLLQLVRK